MYTVNIYRYKTIGANANTGELQLPENESPLSGNPLATIGNPLVPICKLPTIGKFTIGVKGFSVRD